MVNGTLSTEVPTWEWPAATSLISSAMASHMARPPTGLQGEMECVCEQHSRWLTGVSRSRH